MTTSLRIAVDVGGTFTDICIFDETTQKIRVEKVPSTPDDPMKAIIHGVKKSGVNLNHVILFSHGTTVATNALITRNFPKAALITTEGFRDVLEIRDGTKEELWDTYIDVKDPYIRRRDRYEVAERIDYQGNVLIELDEERIMQIAEILRKKSIVSVAICFINSYINPDHEHRAKEILADKLPEVIISTSHDILPEIFEHPRTSTTVANAVLAPLISGYVQRLADSLRHNGYIGDLLILHSGGGSMTPAMCQRFPVRLAASGIAAGAIAVADLAQRCGYSNAIGLDMGGTSTDISLVYANEIRTRNFWQVEYGFPILFPSIEVLTIGAGGGSLAWIDEASSLRNGPQSAGANPGPACYLQEGLEPTNTDANVVLGRLGTSLVGGGVKLDMQAAVTAIENHIATPLSLDVYEAASDVIQVANANMAAAVRLLSVRRGYDPREFVLIVAGGAGALHGAALAKDLSIPTVIVPKHPGIFSAQGCLMVDIRHDVAAMFHMLVSKVDIDYLEKEFERLETEGRARLVAEHVPVERMVFKRSMSLRYLGQWRSLTISCAKGETLVEILKRFHDEYQREYSFRREDAPVEIYRIGVQALGITPKPIFAPEVEKAYEEPVALSTREVYFDEIHKMVQTPIYDRAQLCFGNKLLGPAIVEQIDATVLIPPGTTAEVDIWGNIVITVPLDTSVQGIR